LNVVTESEVIYSRGGLFAEVVGFLPPLLEVIPVAVGIFYRPPILVILAKMTGLEEKNFTCMDEFFFGDIAV
jgi:hypothetical protein